MPDQQITTGGADISDDCVFRYSLWRTWNQGAKSCLFVMLNPSTADANVNDATIGKCIRYTKAWGYGQLLVGNLFAFRATDKRVMMNQTDPVGPQNDATLLRLVAQADVTVAAWGADGGHMGRDRKVLSLLRPLTAVQCLRVNANGTPSHPLHLAEDLCYHPFAG